MKIQYEIRTKLGDNEHKYFVIGANRFESMSEVEAYIKQRFHKSIDDAVSTTFDIVELSISERILGKDEIISLIATPQK